MSETPRTDEVVGQREYGSLADSEYVRLARTLERELNEAKKVIQNNVEQSDFELCDRYAKFLAESLGWTSIVEHNVSQYMVLAVFYSNRNLKTNEIIKERDEWKACAEELAVPHDHGIGISELDRLNCPRCKALTTFDRLKEKSK